MSVNAGYGLHDIRTPLVSMKRSSPLPASTSPEATPYTGGRGRLPFARTSRNVPFHSSTLGSRAQLPLRLPAATNTTISATPPRASSQPLARPPPPSPWPASASLPRSTPLSTSARGTVRNTHQRPPAGVAQYTVTASGTTVRAPPPPSSYTTDRPPQYPPRAGSSPSATTVARRNGDKRSGSVGAYPPQPVATRRSVSTSTSHLGASPVVSPTRVSGPGPLPVTAPGVASSSNGRGRPAPAVYLEPMDRLLLNGQQPWKATATPSRDSQPPYITAALLPSPSNGREMSSHLSPYAQESRGSPVPPSPSRQPRRSVDRGTNTEDRMFWSSMVPPPPSTQRSAGVAPYRAIPAPPPPPRQQQQMHYGDTTARHTPSPIPPQWSLTTPSMQLRRHRYARALVAQSSGKDERPRVPMAESGTFVANVPRVISQHAVPLTYTPRREYSRQMPRQPVQNEKPIVPSLASHGSLASITSSSRSSTSSRRLWRPTKVSAQGPHSVTSVYNAAGQRQPVLPPHRLLVSNSTLGGSESVRLAEALLSGQLVDQRLRVLQRSIGTQVTPLTSATNPPLRQISNEMNWLPHMQLQGSPEQQQHEQKQRLSEQQQQQAAATAPALNVSEDEMAVAPTSASVSALINHPNVASPTPVDAQINPSESEVGVVPVNSFSLRTEVAPLRGKKEVEKPGEKSGGEEGQGEGQPHPPPSAEQPQPLLSNSQRSAGRHSNLHAMTSSTPLSTTIQSSPRMTHASLNESRASQSVGSPHSVYVGTTLEVPIEMPVGSSVPSPITNLNIKLSEYSMSRMSEYSSRPVTATSVTRSAVVPTTAAAMMAASVPDSAQSSEPLSFRGAPATELNPIPPSPLARGEQGGYVDPLEEAVMDAAYMLGTLEDQYIRINEETGEEMEDLVHIVELNRYNRMGPRSYVSKGCFPDVLPMLRYPENGPNVEPLTYFPLTLEGYLNVCAIIWLSRFQSSRIPALLKDACHPLGNRTTSHGSSDHGSTTEDGAAAEELELSYCYFDNPMATLLERFEAEMTEHADATMELLCSSTGMSVAEVCVSLVDRRNLDFMPPAVWKRQDSTMSFVDHVTMILLAATVPQEVTQRVKLQQSTCSPEMAERQKQWRLFLGATPWNYEDSIVGDTLASMPPAAARLSYAFLSRARIHNLNGGIGGLLFSVLSEQIPEAAFFDTLMMMEKLRMALTYSYRNIASCSHLRRAVLQKLESVDALSSRPRQSANSSTSNAPGLTEEWTSPVLSNCATLVIPPISPPSVTLHPAATATTTSEHSNSRRGDMEESGEADLYSIAVQLNCFFPVKTERSMHQLCAALLEDAIEKEWIVIPEEVVTAEGVVLTDPIEIGDSIVNEGAQAMRHIIMMLSERHYTTAVLDEDALATADPSMPRMAALMAAEEPHLVLFDPAVLRFLTTRIPVDGLFQLCCAENPPSLQPHYTGDKSRFAEVLRLHLVAETIQYAMEMQEAILVAAQLPRPSGGGVNDHGAMRQSLDVVRGETPSQSREGLMSGSAGGKVAHSTGRILSSSSLGSRGALSASRDASSTTAAAAEGGEDRASVRSVLVSMCQVDPQKPAAEVAEYLYHLLLLYYEQRTLENEPVESGSPMQVGLARFAAGQLSMTDWFGRLTANGERDPAAPPSRCDTVTVYLEELAALCPRVYSRRYGAQNASTLLPAYPPENEERETAAVVDSNPLAEREYVPEEHEDIVFVEES